MNRLYYTSDTLYTIISILHFLSTISLVLNAQQTYTHLSLDRISFTLLPRFLSERYSCQLMLNITITNLLLASKQFIKFSWQRLVSASSEAILSKTNILKQIQSYMNVQLLYIIFIILIIYLRLTFCYSQREDIAREVFPHAYAYN